MAELILRGASVARVLCDKTAERVRALSEKGIVPCLALLRIGSREEDISYERSAQKRCESLGIRVVSVVLPPDVDEEGVKAAIRKLNGDNSVHAVLIMLPLPENMDSRAVCDTLAPEKDIDGVSSRAMADLYEGRGELFAPCTACACMELMNYYGITPAGKRAVVIGRSIVVGRPAAMLLLRENATVTLCHRQTERLSELTREADIVLAAAGEKGLIRPEWLSPGQTLIDIGTNWDEKTQRLCGDAVPECEKTVRAFSPVPGGVGAVTTAVLAAHTVEAAEKSFRFQVETESGLIGGSYEL